jgi:acyl-CoA synthetase (NDP forming)
VRLHATFATPGVRRGPVALLSESGMIGGALLDRVGEAGLGASSFAAVGNRADVSANDLLQYWADDERTEVVLLYLESFGNARKFNRIARQMSRTKPIVAVKSGGAARAYPSEGDDAPAESLEALVAQTGIVRVDTLAAQLHVARLLVSQPLPAGDRVALLGNGGGSLALAADACVDAGLTLAALGFEAGPEDVVRALTALLADDGVDSVLVVCAPAPRQSTGDLVAAIARARAAAPGKTLVACLFGDHPQVVAVPGQPDVPVLDFPDDAAYALGLVSRYARWRAEPEGEMVVPAGCDPAAARALATGLEGWLPAAEAYDLLAAAGLPTAPSAVVDDESGAAAAAGRLGYPVAAKVVQRDRRAKSEAGGVALDVHDEAELRSRLARMCSALGDAAWPVVVQPMVEPGLDLAVTVAGNPLVGPVVTVGPGGAATGMGATSAHVLPLTDAEARRFVAGLPGQPLPDGPRERLEDLLLRVGALVEGVPELTGLELNPVIVSPGGIAIVDAAVHVTPVERNPLPPVRRVGA